MQTYLYDGSFDGLLTVCFYAYKDSDIYTIDREAGYQPDLLSRPVTIKTELDKAQRIVRSVQQNLSAYTMRNLYLLYLSELPDCDLMCLQYLRLCFQNGAAINNAKHHPLIRKVEDYRHKVTLELDRVKGFLRFQQIDQRVFYARFAPDHNQLPLLMPHLERRFSDQKWIVHDEKRHCALLYNLHQSVLAPFNENEAAQLLEHCQDTTSDLFRQYFQSINIPERANPRLQAGYMPHRYQNYMPETQ